MPYQRIPPQPSREDLDRVCNALHATLLEQGFIGGLAVSALISLGVSLHKQLGGSQDVLEGAFKSAIRAVYKDG